MGRNESGTTLFVRSDTAEKVKEIKKELNEKCRHNVTIDEVINILLRRFNSNDLKEIT